LYATSWSITILKSFQWPEQQWFHVVMLRKTLNKLGTVE
jgi:hypothetical protein